MLSDKKDRLINSAFILMLMFLPIHSNTWSLIGIQFPVQPSELFSMAFILLCCQKKYLNFSKDIFTFSAITWVILNLISSIANGITKTLIIEFIKTGYLFVLFLSVRSYLAVFGKNLLIKFFVISVTLSCLFGLLGFFLDLVGVKNNLVWIVNDFPYFGTVARVRAFTSTPNMLASFILIATFFCAYDWKSEKPLFHRKFIVLCLSLFVVTLLLALSKTLVCIFGGGLIFWAITSNWSKYIKSFLVTISAGVFVFYLVATHFIVSYNSNEIQKTENAGFSGAGVEYAGFYIAPSAYSLIKLGCIEVCKDNLLFGVGPRHFKSRVEELRKKNIYNYNIAAYDPHCTILGAVTELGIISGIFLICIIGYVVYQLLTRLVNEPDSETFFFKSALLCIFITIIIESLVTDVMNFRHYWIIYALTAFSMTKIERIQKS